jgi:hypothetical protein
MPPRKQVIWPLLLAIVVLFAGLNAGVSTAAQTTPTKAAQIRCKAAYRRIHGNSLTHLEVVWRFSITLNFCYNGRRVLPAYTSVSCSVWDTDPVTIQTDGCSTQGGTFAWNNRPTGGYLGQATATFKNCVLVYGCAASVTVTLFIRATGDGHWSSGFTS